MPVRATSPPDSWKGGAQPGSKERLWWKATSSSSTAPAGSTESIIGSEMARGAA